MSKENKQTNGTANSSEVHAELQSCQAKAGARDTRKRHKPKKTGIPIKKP